MVPVRAATHVSVHLWINPAQVAPKCCTFAVCLTGAVSILGCGALTEVEVEVEVNLRPTISRPVSPGVRTPSGTHDQFSFLLEISFRQLRLCYYVAPSLT
jgi:hypothetical protein